jgi:hypothetical protein
MEGILLFLAFLFIVGFPSANLQLFDGLPLSRLVEFGALVLIVPFLIFPDLRNRQLDFWRGWKIRPVFLWGALAVLLLIKGMLLISGTHAGFVACYRSPAEPAAITHDDLPPRTCERSYENLFNRFSATRTDSAVWFPSDTWNLVFLNTNRYDYYDWEEGNILRDRIPLEASWSGVPDVSSGDAIRIQYVGEGTVAVGGTRIALPPSYAAPNEVEFVPSPASGALRIDYTFDDGSRSGQDPKSWGPRAMITVSAGKPGHMAPLGAKSVDPGWRIPALLADGLILLWLISFLPAFWNSIRRDFLVLAVFIAAIGFTALVPFPAILREIGITLLLAAVLVLHMTYRRLNSAALYFCIVAASFAILRSWSSGYGQVLLRSAGNDPLEYESQAYSILITGSLRGGESVFYFQPMYRYVRFFEHVVFGDGNTFSFVAALAMFFGGVVFLFQKTRQSTIAPWLRIILLLAMVFVVFLGGTYVSTTIQDGLSEYPTWIILVLALPALFLGEPDTGLILAFIAMAFSLTVRVNQLPAILWLLVLSAAWKWHQGKKIVVIAIAGAVCVGLLPLLHNVVYGHVPVLFTQGSTSSLLMAVPPQTWLDFLRGSPAAASAVRDQLDALFLTVWVPLRQRPVIAAMSVLLACWLVVWVDSVLRRRWRDWLLLIVPLIFLAPHLIFNVTGYYPKYIFIAYLSMGCILPIIGIRLSGLEKTGVVERKDG